VPSTGHRGASRVNGRVQTLRLAWTTERKVSSCVAQARRFQVRTKALRIVRSIVFNRIDVNRGSGQRRSSPIYGFALYREAVSGTEARSLCLPGGMERQRRKHDGKGSSSRKARGVSVPRPVNAPRKRGPRLPQPRERVRCSRRQADRANTSVTATDPAGA
jgi:hypothetical protein